MANNKIDELEAYNRKTNLIILEIPQTTFAGAISQPSQDGEPATSSTTVENAVLDLVNKRLGVKVTSADISIAHRLRQRSSSSRPPSVIVRFTNTKARDAVYQVRRSLKNSDPSIYINEDLTKSNADLYRQARSLVKDKCSMLPGPPVELSTTGSQEKLIVNLSELSLKPLFKMFRIIFHALK